MKYEYRLLTLHNSGELPSFDTEGALLEAGNDGWYAYAVVRNNHYPSGSITHFMRREVKIDTSKKGFWKRLFNL